MSTAEHTYEKLSRREREVADLVAEGLTNRDIAERLVISERTAEGHVEQIRNKLGFHSRSQIAAWVAGREGHAGVAVPARTSVASQVTAAATPAPRFARVSRRPLARGVALAAALLVTVAAVALWPRPAPPPARLVLVGGIGTDGYSGDGGPAVSAQMSEITSLAVDIDGALLIADSVTNAVGPGDARARIRRIDGSAVIKTVVGQSAVLSFPTDGALAGTLWLNREARIAVGPHGDVYISAGFTEKSGHWLGAIDTTGRFSFIAGGLNGVPTAPPLRTDLLYPRGIAIAADDMVYVADSGNNRVLAIPRRGDIVTVTGTGSRGGSGDGGPARAASLFAPLALALSPDGALYIADTNNHRIRVIDHGGTIKTIGGDGTQGSGGDSGPATRAQLSLPGDLAFGRDGTLYVADTGNVRVRAIATDGTITTVVGSESGLIRPTALAVHPDGSLYIGDSGAHRIFKLAR